MSDRAAELLAAVIADPDADQPRLDYAAYLRGHDDARAELIEVQVALGQRLDPGRRRQAVARERELIGEHKGALSALVHEVVGAHGSWAFRRGFVDEIQLWRDPKSFIANFRQLLAVEPIRTLALNQADSATLELLLGDGIVGRLRTLSLSGDFGSAGARRLAGDAQLGAIGKLNLSDCELGDEGVRALAESAYLGVVNLTLRGNGIGDDGARALAGCARLGSCRCLYLAANDIGDAGLRTLIDSPHLSQLRQLNLRGNSLTDEGAVALLGAEVFPAMVRLEIDQIYGLSENRRESLRERWGARLRI